MNTPLRSMTLVALVVGLLASAGLHAAAPVAGTAAPAAGPAARAPRMSCAALAGREYYNVTITTAVEVPANGSLPAYCKVSGNEAGTAHDLEVRLRANGIERLVLELRPEPVEQQVEALA